LQGKIAIDGNQFVVGRSLDLVVEMQRSTEGADRRIVGVVSAFLVPARHIQTASSKTAAAL